MAGGEIGSAYVRIRPQTAGFKGELSSSLGGAFRSASRVASLAVAGIGVAAAASIGSAVKTAVGFERSMRNVNSIAKLGEQQFQNLGKSVTKMAADVGQKPEILSKGLYDLVSSGFKASDAIKVLEVSSRAATAGLTTTDVSARAVAAAMNAYKLTADDARGVSDVLFQTVNKGVLTFEELAQNMGDLVPAAAPLGVRLEEVGAAMSTLTLQGVPAAEAATRVKSTMLQLASPTENLTALLKEQGFASGEAAIKSKGFAGVLEMIDKATAGNVTATSKLTPEIRALLGVVGLTGKNLATYRDHLKSMNEASKGAGVTAQVFAEQSKSVAVQWQKASAAIDVFKIQVGNALLPALTSGITALAGFMAKLTAAQGFKAKLEVTLEVAKGAVNKIDELLFGIDQRINRGPQTFHVDGIVDKLAAAFQAVDWGAVGSSVIDGISSALKKSAEIAKNLATTITSAIREINWVDVGRTVGPGLAAAIVTAFVTLLDPAFWAKNWELSIAVALTVFGGVIGRAATRLGALLLSALRAPFERAVLALADVIERLSPRLAEAVMGGLLKLPALIGTAFRALGAVVGRALATVETVIRAVFGRLGRLAVFTIKVLGIQAAIAAIADFAQSSIEAVVGFAKAVYKKIQDVIGWFQQMPGRIVSALGNLGDLLYQAGRDVVQGFIDGVQSKAADAWSAVKSIAGGASAEFRAKLRAKSPSLVFLEIGRDVIDGFVIGIESKAAAVKKAMDGVGTVTTASLADARAAVRKLTAMIAADQDASSARDRARAVTDAQAALNEANAQKVTDAASRKDKAKAIEDAERALGDARHAIVVAGWEKRLAVEEKSAAAIQAKVDRALERQTAAVQKATERQKALVEDAKTKMSAAWDALSSRALAAFDAVTSGFISPAQAEINAINKQQKTEDLAQGVVSAEAGITAAKLALDTLLREQIDSQTTLEQKKAKLVEELAEIRKGGNAAAILAAENAVREADQDAADLLAKEATARAAIIAAELTHQRALIAVKVSGEGGLEDQAREEQKAWTESQAGLRETLAEQLKIHKTSAADIIKMLAGFGVEFASTGSNLGKQFADALRAEIDAAIAATKSMVSGAGGNRPDNRPGGGGQSPFPGAASGGDVVRGGAVIVHAGETIIAPGQLATLLDEMRHQTRLQEELVRRDPLVLVPATGVSPAMQALR